MGWEGFDWQGFSITMIAFVCGYLTCSTIKLDDLRMEYDKLVEKYNMLLIDRRNLQEQLQNNTDVQKRKSAKIYKIG